MFFRYISKQNQKENIDPLLNRRGELVTNNTKKAEGLNTFFTSVFTSTVGPQASGTKTQVDANTDPLSVKEESVLNYYRSLIATNQWALTIICLRVLEELADVTVRLLSINFEKL